MSTIQVDDADLRKIAEKALKRESYAVTIPHSLTVTLAKGLLIEAGILPLYDRPTRLAKILYKQITGKDVP